CSKALVLALRLPRPSFASPLVSSSNADPLELHSFPTRRSSDLSLRGDRTAPDGLAALEEAPGDWDVVVDTWSTAPRAVRDTARLLRDRAARYVYVSSCSVYAWAPPAGYTERAPVVDGARADADRTDYARDQRGGGLAAVDAFVAGRSLLVRAGLILGPYENVGRLPWCLTRMARGGPVLAPGPRELPLQYVDARD